MKYMMMVKTDRNSETGRNYETGVSPDSKLMAAIGKHAEEMIKAGVLLETGGLLPISKGARVRAAGGKLAVTDGPLIESKEMIGGYGILQARSKEKRSMFSGLRIRASWRFVKCSTHRTAVPRAQSHSHVAALAGASELGEPMEKNDDQKKKQFY